METEPRDDEYEWIRGVTIPVALMLLVVANLANQTVWTPGRRDAEGLLQAHTDPFLLTGMVLVKAGVAGSLFVWYWMANRQRFDPYIHFLLPITITTAVTGLVVVGVYTINSYLQFP